MSNILDPPDINDVTPIFDAELRSSIMRGYLCAKCWGELRSSPLPNDQWFVYCPNCGTNIGFVTRSYVERCRLQDRIDYMDVYCLLVSLKLLPEENKITDKSKEERILEELGY